MQQEKANQTHKRPSSLFQAVVAIMLLLAPGVDPTAPPDGEVQSFSLTVADRHDDSQTHATIQLSMWFGCSSYEYSISAPRRNTQYVCDAAWPWTVLSTTCGTDGPQHKLMVSNPTTVAGVEIVSFAVTVQHLPGIDTIYIIDGSCTCSSSQPQWTVSAFFEVTPNTCPAWYDKQWLPMAVDNQMDGSGLARGPPHQTLQFASIVRGTDATLSTAHWNGYVSDPTVLLGCATYTHEGCYADTTDFAMDDAMPYYGAAGHTIDSCHAECAHYKYFALEDTDYCFCSNSLLRATQHGAGGGCSSGTGGTLQFDLYHNELFRATNRHHEYISYDDTSRNWSDANALCSSMYGTSLAITETTEDM